MRGPVASAEYEALAPLLPDDLSNPRDSLTEVRAKFDAVHGHDPGSDVLVEASDAGVWVRPGEPCSDESASSGGRAVFFVHGGGFVTSLAASYAFYAANVVRACGLPVFVAEYRLAPETRHPGQIDDLIASYEHLISEGRDPDQLVFMGDSCGGGMALAAAIRLRDAAVPGPGCLVSLCGWFDLEARGDSATRPTGRDPFLDPEWLRRRGRDYVGPDGDPADPAVSPVHADLHGLAPVLLHAGEIDRCRSDAERVAERIRLAGGRVDLEVWAAMPHGFHGLAGVIPEADRALGHVRRFIDEAIPCRGDRGSG